MVSKTSWPGPGPRVYNHTGGYELQKNVSWSELPMIYNNPKSSTHSNDGTQGLLVDLSKKAMITGNYKELDDAIRLKIPK